MGVGTHFCLGAWLAKAIATTTLRELITQAPAYRVDRARAECAPDVSSLNHWEHVPATAR
jgi:cytochrome P450